MLSAVEENRLDSSGGLAGNTAKLPSGNCVRMIEAAIAAGPDAGFEAEGQAALERAGFVKASLGPGILRTETAALAALAALNVLRGDF
jgi:16S rRNA (uracil1498-N3)-methyltransferase